MSPKWQKMSVGCATLGVSDKQRKGSEMDYLDLEISTNTRCAVCSDTLAEWEENICIICECDGE
jgi:hypothetical protein